MKYEIKGYSTQDIQRLIGVNDTNLKLLSTLYETDIIYRNDEFIFMCEDIDKFNKFTKNIDYLLANIDNLDIDLIKQSFLNDNSDIDYANEIIAYSISGKPYKCKTLNQYKFLKAVNSNDLVFVTGPAGTGKTFLAVLMAVNSLKRGDVKKIIITRPAVEAGESLGFLPGDLKEKIDPYLMPIYDALDSILGKEKKDTYIEKGIIEVIPLAYMRGRTLDEAYVILDEAQNTTDKQMLMFLTRLGFNSKMIVNGDITQIDLNINKNNSGLIAAINKLINTKGIGFVEFKNSDVVRNPLVQTIIDKFKV